MKKTFQYILGSLIVVLLLPLASIHAESPIEYGSSTEYTSTVEPSSCQYVDDRDAYNTCCLGYGTMENPSACEDYRKTYMKTPDEARAYCQGIDEVKNQDDYITCCNSTVGYVAHRCDPYAKTKAGGGTGVPVDGQINSGTPGTNALGGTKTLGTEGNPGAPASDSVVLKECSAIKFKSLLDILIWVKCIITAVLIPLIFTLAFLFFMWNVLMFMRSADNTQKEEAKQRMVWGIIALFVMIGVWGIIKILSNTLGINPAVPFLQTETYLAPSSASK